MPLTADQIRDKLIQINDIIIDSEYSVRDGKMVNLGMLDKDVALLCKQCSALSPDDARDIQPLMAEAIGSLERLATALADYKNELRNRK